MNQPIIIIGGSIAGVSAAEAARRQDSDVDILLLSGDPYLPYYRLRICELLDTPTTADELQLHPREWYDERKIRVETGITVTAILPEQKQIRLADGRLLAFSSLVIASGSQSFQPPVTGINRPGVYTIWTLQDVIDISAALPTAHKVAVIGGGLLGLETAYHIKKRGLPTLIIEKAPRLLVRQLDPDASSVLTHHITDQGFEVVTDADIVAFTGASNDPSAPVTGIELADGRKFEADLIVINIGVVSNIGFLEGSGIITQRRIVTNARMQTSIPGIFAAGDAAEPNGYWFGLWAVSRSQGQVAGANAAGGDASFAAIVPPYLLNTMGTRVAVQGDPGQPGDPTYEVDVLFDLEGGNFRKLVFKSGIFVGFTLIGDHVEFAKLQKQLGQPGPINDQ